MGKKTKLKHQADAAREQSFQTQFAQRSAQAKQATAPTPLLDELLEYHDQFVRDPAEFSVKTKSSNRHKQFMELVRHVFGRYPVPRQLDQAWFVPDPVVAYGRYAAHLPPRRAVVNINDRQLNFRQWYIALATGQSLYKTVTKAFLTKMETHWFVTCPQPSLSLAQTLYYAVAKAHGANEGLAMRLGRSKLHEQPFDAFWKDATRFFSQPEHMPATLAALNDLVDYLRAQRQEQPGFQMLGMGHTLASLTKRMTDWHYALRRVKIMGQAQWEGLALPNERLPITLEGQKCHWHVIQIKSTKELAAEGTAMRHCVYSYKDRCMQGHCSIWSLCLETPNGDLKRKLTLEVNASGHIVQQRGLANRLPRADERHALTLWARATHGIIRP